MECIPLVQYDSFVKCITNTEHLYTGKIDTLQVNITKKCNLACEHCHVESSPKRKESMTQETMQDCIDLLKKFEFTTLDITGGAPEIHPHLKEFILAAKPYVKKIIVRTNLVILNLKSYANYMQFFAENKISLVASLPCYTEDNTDKMRGKGVFKNSIEVIKKLNKLGYGLEDHLPLDFVYNPGGPFLPGAQAKLEQDYKRILAENHDIYFNSLYTITNMIIGRYETFLRQQNKLITYQKLLEDNFNPDSLANLMCRRQLSISWDGFIYDCDFNQMIELKTNGYKSLKEALASDSLHRVVVYRNHCYGCTAGAGSSCGGALT